MRNTRYSRNPRIARTLVEFDWVRELNEGVQRIYSEMQKMLLSDPVYSEPAGMKVKLTLENNIVARSVRRKEALEERLPEGLLSEMGEYELMAVRHAFASGRITTKTFSEITGKGSSYCGKVLKGLAGKGVLAWHGTSTNDPHQFYSVNL